MIFNIKLFQLGVVLSICFSLQESIQSDNSHDEIALAFTSNILSGMNFIPKEKQLSMLKVNKLFESYNIESITRK